MKTKNAFTLIETLFAIGILAVSITILSSLQVRSVLNVLKGREEIDRIFWVKKGLYSIFLDVPEKPKPIVEDIEHLNLKVVSQVLDIEKKSSLKDFADNVQIVQSEGRWASDLGARSIKMISFVLKPEEKKK